MLTSRRPGSAKGAPGGEPDDHAVGRSRGGLTTDIHLAVDGRCRPLAFVLTAGQAGDAPAFTEVMAGLRVPRRRGWPRTRPEVVLVDKAYSSREIRIHLRRRGVRAVIPERADQRADRMRRGRADGRPPAFDREAYKQRSTVERCINRLKRWRGITTRCALRGDRDRLPGRTPRRRHLPLARPMIHTTLTVGQEQYPSR